MPRKQSFLTKAVGRLGLALLRSSLENPQTPLSYPAEWLLDIFNGGRTDSGLRVSEMTAIQVTTVFQCVNIICNGIAAHPLNVYSTQAKSGRTAKIKAPDHPLFDILHHEPNVEMTSTTWRKTMQSHILLWGNGYSELQRNGKGQVIAIWPRNPARTRPVRITESMTIEGTTYPPGTLVYETYETLGDSQIMEQDYAGDKFGTRRLVLAEDMLHIPGLSLDGRLGNDVVILARQAIGLALATEKFGAKYFGNSAIPAGLLSTAGDMSDIQFETFRRSWAEAHGGENAHKTGVLPPGVTFQKIQDTAESAQMINTRKYQRQEIASVFNVPGHMVGVSGDDAGKATVEQSSIEFKLFCLDPHIVAWEQELRRKLFYKTGSTPNKYVAGFDLRKLMYPDAASRSAYYSSGKQWGYLCTDDIHELEGMNPVEDGSGEKYWMPNNMVDAGMAATHADQVTDGLDNGTLAATPPGVTPVGSHPIVKAQLAESKARMKLASDNAQLNAKTQVQISKNQGQNSDPNGPNKPGPGLAPPAAKKSKKREDALRVFSGVFRDAVGRASFRKKPTTADYVAVFGPLVHAIAEEMFEDSVDSSEFIKAYTNDLFNARSTGWGENLDEVAANELDNLIELLLRA